MLSRYVYTYRSLLVFSLPQVAGCTGTCHSPDSRGPWIPAQAPDGVGIRLLVMKKVGAVAESNVLSSRISLKFTGVYSQFIGRSRACKDLGLQTLSDS